MYESSQVFIITFAIVILGFLLKKFNFLTENDGKSISKLLMHTTFPALMIISTANAKIVHAYFLIPLFAILLGIVMILIAWYFLSNYENSLRGVLMMGAGGYNTGLFGFAIIEGLFGKESLIYAVMFDIGVSVIVFGVIYSLAIYFSPVKKAGINIKQIVKKIFSLPPVIGMTIGLIINFLSLPLPPICITFLEVLSKANRPLVLLLMGIYLSFELNKRLLIAMSKVLAIRYLLGLAVIIILYYSLPNYPNLQHVLMICTILPIGMTIIPFSIELNYDTRTAGTLLNISQILSFILMWVLALFLKM
jgi:malate permease and related proteins